MNSRRESFTREPGRAKPAASPRNVLRERGSLVDALRCGSRLLPLGDQLHVV